MSSSDVGVFEFRLAPAPQLKDLTVEATLSWEECCEPFRLSDESRLFMASNDFLRSAMVNDDDLEAGFPGGSPLPTDPAEAPTTVLVDEMLLLSLTCPD